MCLVADWFVTSQYKERYDRVGVTEIVAYKVLERSTTLLEDGEYHYRTPWMKVPAHKGLNRAHCPHSTATYCPPAHRDQVINGGACHLFTTYVAAASAIEVLYQNGYATDSGVRPRKTKSYIIARCIFKPDALIAYGNWDGHHQWPSVCVREYSIVEFDVEAPHDDAPTLWEPTKEPAKEEAVPA